MGLSNLRKPNLNGQLLHFSAASAAVLRPIYHGQTTAGGGQQVRRLLYGIPLPLPRLLHFTHDYSVHVTGIQIPHLLPHPSPPSLLPPRQETLQTLAPNFTANRDYSRVSKGYSNSDGYSTFRTLAPYPGTSRGFGFISNGYFDSDGSSLLEPLAPNFTSKRDVSRGSNGFSNSDGYSTFQAQALNPGTRSGFGSISKGYFDSDGNSSMEPLTPNFTSNRDVSSVSNGYSNSDRFLTFEARTPNPGTSSGFGGISNVYLYSDANSSLRSVAPNFTTRRDFCISNRYSKFEPVASNFRTRRGFCVVSNGCSDFEADSESDTENVEKIEAGNVESKADLKEVERVCKVIDELFALDRNMEAVLDSCGVNLTHDLVVEVLERFRHARRPAFRFFCWAGQRAEYSHDSRTYNKMMFILGKTRQFETMVTMLEEIGDRGLLTIETFEIAIKAFCEAKERRKAVGIFELMKKYKFKVGVDTINCLLDSLGRAKLGKEAQLMFDKLKERFTPNLRTYTVLLNGWCRVKNLLEAVRVWNEMIDKGFKPDIIAHHTMLEGLLRCRKRSDAIKLFEVMKAKGPNPNVRSYTILIRDLCKQMKMREAVDYFEEMAKSGCYPDAAVYTCLITGFGNKKEMDKVYGLLTEMKEKGLPPDVQTYNALIKLMTNKRMPDDAVRIYKQMIKCGFEPTIHTYNMMMRSYLETRNYEMGYAVWEEMNRKGCCPDDNSYIVLIGGLIRQGRSQEACRYLEEMIEKGMKAPQLDYNKFAADFSRAGKPDILEELARKMKFSGKFEASNVFSRWGEMMKKRVNRRDPD